MCLVTSFLAFPTIARAAYVISIEASGTKGLYELQLCMNLGFAEDCSASVTSLLCLSFGKQRVNLKQTSELLY